MAHIPVNHTLRPIYRVLAALTGLYILVFGILTVARTGGLGFFAQHGLPSVLGIRGNRAFGILSIIVGLVIVAGAIIGHNIDHWLNLVGGIVFMVAGLAMMVFMQSNLNYLGFAMATCIASFIIGMILFAAGLYGKTGTAADTRAEEEYRHGRGADPQWHGPALTPHTPRGGAADGGEEIVRAEGREHANGRGWVTGPSVTRSASGRGATGRSRRG